MKISLEWLNEYVQITESAEELAEMLMNLGFETESIESIDGTEVIDLEVTSNRGDCLSHIGIAREIAAAAGRELKIPELKLETIKKDISKMVSVKIESPDLCPRYTARIIEGVKVGPAPEWMKKRLEAVGIRSVNNVVDATNYALMETGQPPHAFDFAKIAGNKIVVRCAKKGESLVAIDGTQCKLAPDMLIIADAEKPVAIAGVMGGLETEVSETTTDILLEDASFDAVSVRTTGRGLVISSEASFRFERIVDIENIDFASQRTAELIAAVAGGKIVEGVVDAYPKKAQQKTVSLRPTRVEKLLGVEVPRDEIMRILTGLCFEPKETGDDTITCTVPSWRSDVYREADLIEEVGRMFGYDKVPVTDKINIRVVRPDVRQQVIAAINQTLNGLGFYETINVTFTNEKTAKLIEGKKPQGNLAVLDVTRKNDNILRGSLIGSLIEVLRVNLNAGNKKIKIYEIANVFAKLDDKKRYEGTKLSILCNSDFQTLRAAVESAIKAVSKKTVVDIKPADVTWASAGGEIIADGKTIGTAGVVNDNVIKAFDIKNEQACAAEIDFDSILELEKDIVKAQPIPKFPAIERALSLIVDEQTTWAQITEVINIKSPAELENIGFEGIYRGKPIEKGKKSVTVSLRFRDADGTLTHETVDGWEKTILDKLIKKTNALLRST